MHRQRLVPLVFPTSDAAVIFQLTEANVLAFLRSAPGSASYRTLPIPKEWDVVDRPHVALLDAVDDTVFCFFVSSPSREGSELNVKDMRELPVGTIIEVRYNGLDYRYYRREEEAWRLVAEVRSHLLMEIYDLANIPVLLPLSEDRILAAQ